MDDRKQNLDSSFNKTKELDLVGLIKRLWGGRLIIFKAIGVGFLIGLVISFSIPKTYKAYALLAPESTQANSGRMSGMAAMLGLGSMMGQMGVDAISINHVEDIVATTPFLMDLRNVRVRTLDESIDTTVVGYLSMQRGPWWSSLLSLPRKTIAGAFSLFRSKNDSLITEKINPFHLNKVQDGQIALLGHSIKADIDNKTRLIEVSAVFQDPMVAALVADSVLSKLQHYLISYRTHKAQQDCEYLEKLYLEAQQQYYEAQDQYARFMDSNQNIIRKSASTESIRMQNEMNIAFQVYSQLATQLQLAKAKVQEVKPTFTIVEPVRVPLYHNGPNKKMIIFVFVFLAFIASSAWVMFVKDLFFYLKDIFK